MLFPSIDAVPAGEWAPCAADPLDVARSAWAKDVPVFYFGGREEVVGLGVAWRSDDLAIPLSCGGRFVFSFPFDGPVGAGNVVLPAVILARRDEGTRLWIAPGPGLEGSRALLNGLEDPGAPEVETGRVVAMDPGPTEWASSVKRARGAIRAGLLSKVVLARSVILSIGVVRPFDVVALLRKRFPHSYVFGWAENGVSFVGASPELLVEKRGSMIRSFPLAGSVGREENPTDDEAAAKRLLGSAKDRAEHQFVVDEIAGALTPLTSRLSVPSQPSVMRLANIQHLGTEIEGVLTARMGVRNLAMALHPTPAVCGTPTEAALAFIRSAETFDRGWYAGGIGWTDPSGDGEAAVALRCALLEGERARVYAGAGIVADSDPAAELAETDAKLRALLDILESDPDT